jgi:hypothetical protein
VAQYQVQRVASIKILFFKYPLVGPAKLVQQPEDMMSLIRVGQEI